MKRICLYLDPSRLFQWHVWLSEALTAIPGNLVKIRFATDDLRPLPWSCKMLFELERLVYGISGPTAMSPLNARQFTDVISGIASVDETFDVIVDLAATGMGGTTKRILMPFFNGVPGEVGALTSLFGDAPLSIEIHDLDHFTPWRAQPATSERHIFLKSLDNILSCTVALIVKAVSETGSYETVTMPSYCMPHSSSRGALLCAAENLAGKIGRALVILAKGHKRWATAWRFIHMTNSLIVKPTTGDFTILPDDGKHFYADPFPFYYKGQYYLFVEDFSYAEGRACISVARIEGLHAATPVPVLEEPYHLSYPFVFEHDGEVWMVPETGAANGIYLYRADPFPSKWKREACLLSDISAHDTTLILPSHPNEKIWMFVCQKVWNSSSWDGLSLFSSDRLTGPWLPHDQNPIFFDATQSRSAGAVFRCNDHFVRPAQDNSRQYGGRIMLCRIDAMAQDRFTQTITGVIESQEGCHTYNNCDGLEVIDVFGRTRGSTKIAASYRNSLDKHHG